MNGGCTPVWHFVNFQMPVFCGKYRVLPRRGEMGVIRFHTFLPQVLSLFWEREKSSIGFRGENYFYVR